MAVLTWIAVCALLYGAALLIRTESTGHLLMGLALLATASTIMWLRFRKK